MFAEFMQFGFFDRKSMDSMDPQVKVRFESKCCDCLAICLEKVTLPSRGSVSLQTKWENWSSIPLELPALSVSSTCWIIWIPHIYSLQSLNANDWLLSLPPQNIFVSDPKMIQMCYQLPNIGLIFLYWSFACMPQVRFASLLYWKTKAHLCNLPLQLLA